MALDMPSLSREFVPGSCLLTAVVKGAGGLSRAFMALRLCLSLAASPE